VDALGDDWGADHAASPRREPEGGQLEQRRATVKYGPDSALIMKNGKCLLARPGPKSDDGGMTTLLELVAGAFVLFSLAALVGWLAFRRVRRAVRIWHERVLATRVQWMVPGPRREVAMLRHRLAREM
jgi:hypothetical protein